MQMNISLLTTDLFKSVILHITLLIIIISSNYATNRKVFLEVKLTNNSITDNMPSMPNIKPVTASLVDQKAVEQAVKRQERLFAEKVAREKQLVQQEQKIAKLKLQAEEDAKQNKLEQTSLKKERELLKKEQDNLQKTVSKLKQQQQDLLSQQAKIEQLSRQNLIAQQNAENQKKKVNNIVNKNLDNHNINGINIRNTVLTEQEHGVIQTYYSKMKIKIINNRKDTSLFSSSLECIIAIKLLSDGRLSSVKLLKSSGNSVYDAFSEQAVYKSAPFELPTDPKLTKQFTEDEQAFIFTVEH